VPTSVSVARLTPAYTVRLLI